MRLYMLSLTESAKGERLLCGLRERLQEETRSKQEISKENRSLLQVYTQFRATNCKPTTDS